MTLEQLMAEGLDEETAKKVLKVHQDSIKDEYIPIARFNEVNEEKKELKTQIEERDTQLGELKVKATGNEGLTTKIAELETLNNTTKVEYEEKIKALRKETSIELALKDSKAKNVKAVKALLDLEKVSLDGENLIGLEEQLEGLKESESYLFGKDTLKGRDPNAPQDTSKSQRMTKEQFNNMGYSDKVNLKNSDPELYDSLR